MGVNKVRGDVEIGFRAIAAMLEDLQELERHLPASKRGSRVQAVLDRMKDRAQGVEYCMRDVNDAPPADRIALARELLAGTGRVVARETGSVTPESVPWRYGDSWHGVQDGADKDALAAICDGYADGWNACRAAMLEEG